MTQKVSTDDVAQAMRLLDEVKQTAGHALNHFKGLLQRVTDGELKTAKGVSFLEVKNQLMLSYLANLGHVMCMKTHGDSINNSPSVDRLIELRTVLEKMRPIDQKLKYQVDKLIKTATTGVGENDPLRYKPNPDNLASKLDGEDEEEGSGGDSDDGGESSKTGKYRPPKMAAVHYEGDDTQAERATKLKDRAMKRALSSSIMKELHDEYYEGPEEVRDTRDFHRISEDKAAKERQEYEEKYLLRMPVTKQQKTQSRKLASMAGLQTLTHFGDISALTAGDGIDENAMRGKKRKAGKAKPKKGGKKKKKIRRL